MGPVLVKQDQAEAKSNVETRLDFIRSEMLVFLCNNHPILKSFSLSKRVETQLKDIGEKQEKKKLEVSEQY